MVLVKTLLCENRRLYKFLILVKIQYWVETDQLCYQMFRSKIRIYKKLSLQNLGFQKGRKILVIE